MRADAFREQLSQQLASAADRILLRVLVARSDATPVELAGSELLKRSVALADQYCDAPPRGVVLLLLPHSVELFLLHIGLVLRGRLPAILAWPTNRIDPQKYQRNLLHQLRNLPAAQLVTLPGLARNLDPGLSYRVTACPVAGHERLERSFSADLGIASAAKHYSKEAPEDTPEEALFLQFSGGTTGAQKCVVVTSEMLSRQLSRLSDVVEFGQDDVVVSWLPMYHDMGLIACLWLPLWANASSVQFSASDWLMDPGLLFRLMDRYRGTFTWLPNFAFSYLAGQKDRIRDPVNLSHVRAWINCSEPVRRRSMAAFSDAFAGLGVRLSQCQASYAMAENVFAVTQTPLEATPAMTPRMALTREARSSPDLAYGLLDDVYVSSGWTLGGMGVRVRASAGHLCQDREPGGIEIQGESLFFGYWGNDGFQTQTVTPDGWYATGDYGFTDGRDLYVIGRTKDILIVAGQNVYPEDVEAVAGSAQGLYPGRVVAFGVEDTALGTESLAVVAEMRGQFEAVSARSDRAGDPAPGIVRDRDRAAPRPRRARTVDRQEHRRQDLAPGDTNSIPGKAGP